MTPTTAADAEETPVLKGLFILRLISTYPREKLLVHLLIWTTRHLDLLRCEFFNGGIIRIASTLQEQPPNISAILTPATSPSPPDSTPAEDYDTSELQRYFTDLNSEILAAGTTRDFQRHHFKAECPHTTLRRAQAPSVRLQPISTTVCTPPPPNTPS